MIMDQFPGLIVAIPLLLSLFIILFGLINRKFCYPIVLIAISSCIVFAVGLLNKVISSGKVIHYYMGGWDPPWGIELVVDHLTAFMLVIVTIVSLIVAIYSKRSVEKELPGKELPFYVLFLLLITGLIGTVITGDLFNVFVLLEITALSCYSLIAMGRDGAPIATFKYIVMGTIGASFYLLGVGYLYLSTGSLNMGDVSQLLPELYQSKAVMTAGVFMLVGIALKMAIYPLHAWAPNAYSNAPSSVSSLVAPLMTKVAAYLMIRVMYTIFGAEFSIEVIPATAILSWMGAIAVILGSIYAISQSDLKRMLSYSIIAQIGYIAIGIGLANKSGLTGAVLHILNEAFTKGCVFMVAGAIMYKLGGCQIDSFKNLYRKMPFTMTAFVLAAFSMVGIPPTCGFFSKLYLILGSVDAGQWVFVAVLLFSSILNVVYFFRVIQIATFETPMPDYGRDKPYDLIDMDEVPMSMLVPIILSALGILVCGLLSSDIISIVIKEVIPMSFF